MSHEEHFKVCPSCQQSWSSRTDFLADPSLDLNGYKADFQDLEYGMFFFTHTVSSCCSTMVLMVNDFSSLYSGARHPDNKALSEECPRYCVDEDQMARCDAICECAFVREVIDIIKSYRKTTTLPT